MMTKDIIEKTASLKPWQIEKINNTVLGNDIPWFYSNDSVYGDNLNYWSHVLLHRKEENKNTVNNSPLTDFFIDIFNTIAEENNINVNEILRASLNATFYHPVDYGTVHLDHEFPHNNFIMYLNDIDNAGTAIFDNDELRYTSSSSKFNYIIFPGLKHAQLFPPPGKRRVVFVLTFR